MEEEEEETEKEEEEEDEEEEEEEEEARGAPANIAPTNASIGALDAETEDDDDDSDKTEDDDEKEGGGNGGGVGSDARASPAAAPPASAPPAGGPLAASPATWEVWLGGAWKPYDTPISDAIEAARTAGKSQAEVTVRGGAYVIVGILGSSDMRRSSRFS